MRLGTPFLRRLIAIAALLVIAAVSARAFHTPRGFRGGLTDLQSAFVRTGIAIGGWAYAVGSAVRTPGSLRTLASENNRLRVENATLIRALAEADARSKPSALPPAITAPTITARIVAAEFRGPTQTVVLAAGSSDGVVEGDPVLATGALVGVVAEVGEHRAVVRLLGDYRVRIAAELARRSGAVGTTEPDPGGGIVLTMIPRDADLSVGDAVVTAAVNPGVPPAIPIGTLTDLRTDSDGFFRRATIHPAGDPRAQWFLTVLRVSGG